MVHELVIILEHMMVKSVDCKPCHYMPQPVFCFHPFRTLHCRGILELFFSLMLSSFLVSLSAILSMMM